MYSFDNLGIHVIWSCNLITFFISASRKRINWCRDISGNIWYKLVVSSQESIIMIGYLKGRVIDKTLNEVWVDVRDVGYRVRLGSNVRQLMIIGEEIELFIHTHVREDVLELYGFESRQQLSMFEVMISVSGVGPKTALGIVGGARVDQIEKAVRDADVGFFTQFSGIGKKGAQRILVDLKGKMPRIKELDLSEESESNDTVVMALASFGFSKAEIAAVMGSVDTTLSDEDKVREGLRRLGR